MSESLGATLAELASVALDLRARIAAKRYTLRVRDRAALVRLATALEPDLAVIPTLMVPPFGPTSPGALPADPDTTAPTQPTGLNGAPGSDSITWTWDASADGHDGTAAASGVASYDLELDGAVTSVAAPDANALGLPTLANVGTFSPAPTFARSGNTTTLTTAGTGFDGTADQLAFAHWSTTGNFKLTGKVQSFTGSGGEYAPAGLMVRESTAAGSRYVAVYQWLSAVSKGVQCKHRPTTDGAKVTGSFADGDNAARWLQIDRTGDVFTFRWSTDGGSWNDLGTVTLALSSDVLIGCFASDLQVTPAALTATFSEVHYTNSDRPAYTQTGVSASVSARIRARDASGNLSTWSPPVSRSPSSGATMAWNPNDYVRTNSQPYDENRSTLIAEYSTIFADVGANISGIATQFAWGDIEETKGDYSAGFAMIDAHIAACESLGYKLILQLKTRKFGGSSVPSVPQANQKATPDYLISEGQVFVCSDGGGEGAALHRSYVMDRLLLMLAALGERYNDNPTVEAIEFGELSYNMANDAAQWGETNYITQVNRLADNLRTYFPNKACYVGINYVWGQSQTQTFATRAMDAGIGMSGPDAITNESDGPASWPRQSSWGAYVFRGYAWNGSTRFDSATIPDRYLELPSKYEMQVIPNSGMTAQIYREFARDYLKCTHFVWTRYTAGTAVPRGGPSSVTACEWDLGVIPYLNSSPGPLRITFPTRYTDDGFSPVTG